MPEGQARKACQPLRRAFLQKMGLPAGTAAADSYVWMAEQDELAVERVLALMRLLGGGGVQWWVGWWWGAVTFIYLEPFRTITNDHEKQGFIIKAGTQTHHEVHVSFSSRGGATL